MTRPELSIIIPVYNEEKNVKILFDEITQATHGISYEIIFIDDGSNDRTAEKLDKIKKQNSNVKIFKFTKNFGKASGYMCGFDHSKGDYIITLDGDLQDDPSEIKRFLQALKKYDMVVGWKKRRKDPLSKRLPSRFFNYLTKVFTGVKVHDSNCGFKGFRKKVINNLNFYGELHRYLPSIALWDGFSVGEIIVNHRPRRFGKSKYGVSRLVKGLLDLITIRFLVTYGRRPLHFFGTLGFISMFFGFLAGAYLTFLKFIGESIGKRPLLILAVLLIVIGVQFISLGLIGEMINQGKKGKDYELK